MKKYEPDVYPSGLRVYTLDAQYLNSEFASVYLVVDSSGDGHLIDCATGPCFETLLQQIQSIPFSLEKIKYLWITHVHLDHAGGASRWVKALPWLRVYAHPKTARHLVDPSRLIKSASEVYGEASFNNLYGKIIGIPESQVFPLEADALLPLQENTTIKALHTRGHANHHACFHFLEENIVFTGDSFGLHYPAINFAFPSTSPTDFEPTLATQTIHQLIHLKSKALYPTHFGKVPHIHKAAEELTQWLNCCQEWIRQLDQENRLQILSDEALLQWIKNKWLEEMEKTYFHHQKLPAKIATLLDLDLNLNAQGMLHFWKKTKSLPHS